jgi:hypothetical protein
VKEKAGFSTAEDRPQTDEPASLEMTEI